MLNWAVGREYLDRTPFRRGTETLIRKLQEDNRRRRRVSEDEEQRLLEVAPPFLRSMMITALDTGMRQGEMLALRFADIDWKRQLIVLRGQTTKSRKTRCGADRDCPASGGPGVAPTRCGRREEARRCPRLQRRSRRSDRPIPNGVGHGHSQSARYQAGVEGIRVDGTDAGMPDEVRRINLHWHDLRHEYASRLVEKGVPLAQVRDLLGHASITTTERYDNQKLENLQAAAARLESGKSFNPAPRASAPPTNCQVFVKSSIEKPVSDTSQRPSTTGTKALEDGELEEWLGVRDGIRNWLLTAA